MTIRDRWEWAGAEIAETDGLGEKNWLTEKTWKNHKNKTLKKNQKEKVQQPEKNKIINNKFINLHKW